MATKLSYNEQLSVGANDLLFYRTAKVSVPGYAVTGYVSRVDGDLKTTVYAVWFYDHLEDRFTPGIVFTSSTGDHRGPVAEAHRALEQHVAKL